jgi:precorrin-8X/cobalt-precorrin-8 methylmutase
VTSLFHPILLESFATIDREIGPHSFDDREYAIVRRAIHATADFEFKEAIRFSPGAIASGIDALRRGTPAIADVTMVKQGVAGLLGKTFNNPLLAAVDRCQQAPPGKTRTEAGILECFAEHPEGIFVIGNAPTALLALCDAIQRSDRRPALIVGAPVGFVSVVESKQVLAETDVPQIRIDGRKGGSPVAAAILNALIVLAWQNNGQTDDDA